MEGRLPPKIGVPDVGPGWDRYHSTRLDAPDRMVPETQLPGDDPEIDLAGQP